MDLRGFYLEHIQKAEFHYRFYDSVKNINKRYNVFEGYIGTDTYEYEVYDTEEAITKFRELCRPEENFGSEDKKCWFYLITYYLHKSGYVIKEFPKLLARPPVDPYDFSCKEIRDRIKEQGDDDNGTVRYEARRKYVADLTFERQLSYIGIDDSINQKFIEISTRQASFDKMSRDEKLAEIANLIENLLKKNGSFISLDYSAICFDFISDDMVKAYRKMMQCYRHAEDEALKERNCHSVKQKDFLIDYGLTIVKAMHSLLAK